MSCAPFPTAAQVHATRQLIANRIREIESAEEQIRQHEAHIAALRSKIDKTYDAIAADEAYIAPVRRIPFEILGDIITLRTTDPLAPVQVLRDLGSVCKFWRHTTLSTPKAWTRVPIYVPFRSSDEDRDGPRKSLQTLRDVQEWYTRSGICKKDVYFQQCSETDELISILDWVLDRPELLRTFAPRIYLKGNSWDTRLSRPMPALQALDFTYSSPTEDVLPALATSSPRLSCLKISGLPSSDFLVPVQARMKSLSVSDLSIASFFCMLRAGQGFVELRALTVYFTPTYGAATPPLDTDPIPLPNLRTLFLKVEDITVPFFEILQMPRLESLAVSRTTSSLRNVTKKQVAEFLRFGMTGDLSLRELRLSDFWISDADLLKLLKRTPQLELLAVVNAKTSDKVMDALSAKQPGKPARWLCPNLSRLCIISDRASKSDKFRVTQDGIGALVTARLRANMPSPRRAAGPPVARLMDVRLDRHDIVFSSILDTEWDWKLDEKESHWFDTIDPRHPLLDEVMWWHYQAQWDEVY